MGANLQAPNFGFGRLSIHAVCATSWVPGALVFIAAAQRSEGKTCAESQARHQRVPQPPWDSLPSPAASPQSHMCGGGCRASGTQTRAAIPTNHQWAMTCHKTTASCGDACVPEAAAFHGKPSPGSVISSHTALQTPASNPRRLASRRCIPGCRSSNVFRHLPPLSKRTLLQGNRLTISTTIQASQGSRVTHER